MRLNLQETLDKLLSANKIAITAHVNPDGDAIGSSLALMNMLKMCGKEATVYIDDKLPKIFSILPGFSTIKTNITKPIDADLLVVLDAPLNRTGRVAEFTRGVDILNIDHHISNQDEDKFLYVDSKRAATAEILFQLFSLLKTKLTLEVAIPLYTGIATDTGFFRFANTTSFTMQAAGKLLEIGVKPNLIAEAVEEKSYATIKGLGFALQNIEIFHSGEIAGIFLEKKIADTIDSTDSYLDYVRVIEGVQIAVLIKEVEENTCRISIRSKGINVSKVAVSLGGGGHLRAAGCTLSMKLNEAKELVLKRLFVALEEARTDN